jgi:hypothetical protein
MSQRHLIASLMALPAFSMIAAAELRAEPVDALAALCKSNPDCAYHNGSTNGAVAFRIQRGSSIVWINCSANAECVRSFPRGRYTAIKDTEALLTAE